MLYRNINLKIILVDFRLNRKYIYIKNLAIILHNNISDVNIRVNI